MGELDIYCEVYENTPGVYVHEWRLEDHIPLDNPEKCALHTAVLLARAVSRKWEKPGELLVDEVAASQPSAPCLVRVVAVPHNIVGLGARLAGYTVESRHMDHGMLSLGRMVIYSQTILDNAGFGRMIVFHEDMVMDADIGVYNCDYSPRHLEILPQMP